MPRSWGIQSGENLTMVDVARVIRKASQMEDTKFAK